MARHLRLEFAGAIYHVTVRMIGGVGISSTGLFRDDRDRERFLTQLSERIELFNIRLYAFCLMDSHWHLEMETPVGNLGRFMQSLITAYTVYYNLRHDRRGHLTQGRYGAKLVGGTDYILSLSRYIHLNPVRTGAFAEIPALERIQYLRNFQWSSFGSYIGWRRSDEFITHEPILALFKGSSAKQRKAYRKFVEDGVDEHDIPFRTALKASALSVGNDAFRQLAQAKYQEMARSKTREDVSFRQVRMAISPEQVLRVVSNAMEVDVGMLKQQHRNSFLRGIAARMLCQYAGMTQRAAARELGIKSGSAIGQQIRKVAGALHNDSKLGQQLQIIEAQLTALRNSG